ncbi:MAG: spore cortex biosynthesis protein YabQ [Oscillospiraceae bacterium]|nr:spore cortex biosynthesis protein YabQ [Oscillospiraceae bacterium]
MAYQFREMYMSLGLGLACGVFYDLLRAIRRRLPVRAVTALCDGLFCLVSVTALMLLGLTVGEGRQRVFMAVFALLAGGIYACTLSPGVFKLWSAVVGIAAVPLGLIRSGLRFFYVFLKKVFHFVIDGVIITWYKFIMRQCLHKKSAENKSA